MQLQGTIIYILPLRSGVSQRGEWKSQDFVLQYQEGQYTKHMVFTVFGDERLAKFNIQQNQIVEVAFDIDAKEWNGRWFNSINAFEVHPLQMQQQTPNPTPQYQQPQPQQYAQPQPQQYVQPQPSSAQSGGAAQYQQPAVENPDNLPF